MQQFKRRVIASSISLLISSFAFATPFTGAECKDNPFVDSEVLVRLEPNTSIDKIQAALNNAGAESVAQLFNVPAEDAGHPITQWHRVTLKKGVEATQAMQNFGHIAGIAMIEPDYVIELDSVKIPADDRVDDQWAIMNDGSGSNALDADMDLPEAWNIETGDKDIVVAIVDTGIDYNHADLVDNIWKNDGEIANNGIDDDGNNFIDDYDGWDFADREKNPIDVDGHGTHVAGIVGAMTNNGTGVAGVAWDVQLMPLKIFKDSGSSSSSAASEAIIYAANNGADIINASWSQSSYSFAIYNAIQYARDKGLLVVASASNNGQNLDNSARYPAAFNLENILTVGNSNKQDNRHSTSNYGQNSVDVFAPGEFIVSTGLNDGYYFGTGTSQAAPQVAGLAALLKSQDENRTWTELKSIIMDSAEEVPELANLSVSGGRANAADALELGANSVSTLDTMYLRGTNNGWDDSTPMNLIGDNTWEIIAYFSNAGSDEYKFDEKADWSNNFGDNENDGYTESSGANIPVSQGVGDYRITFNSTTGEHSASLITHNHAANQPQVLLRSSSDNYKKHRMVLVSDNTWQLSIDSAPIATQYKFDVFGDWSTNYGDNNTDNTAELDGTEITLAANQGRVTIQFNDSSLAYSVTPVTYSGTQSQMYLRTASSNWNTTAMSLVASNTWQVVTTLGSEMDFKFDVQGDWSLNYGDNNADMQAEINGGNIAALHGAGDYLMTFNDSTLEYSVVKIGYAHHSDTMYLRGTSNNWGTDAMSLIGDYIWAIDADFSGQPSKELKFDVNGTWDASYGDNDANGIADYNSSINIVPGGSSADQKVLFNQDTLKYQTFNR